MGVVNLDDITSQITEAGETIKKASGGQLPDGWDKALEVINGIKDLLAATQNIGQQNNRQPETMESASVKNFTPPAIPAGIKQNNIPDVKRPQKDIMKEVFKGFNKSLATLEAVGYGNRKIGEVIMEAPFTVKQIHEKLDKIYRENYPD